LWKREPDLLARCARLLPLGKMADLDCWITGLRGNSPTPAGNRIIELYDSTRRPGVTSSN